MLLSHRVRPGEMHILAASPRSHLLSFQFPTITGKVGCGWSSWTVGRLVYGTHQLPSLLNVHYGNWCPWHFSCFKSGWRQTQRCPMSLPWLTQIWIPPSTSHPSEDTPALRFMRQGLGRICISCHFHTKESHASSLHFSLPRGIAVGQASAALRGHFWASTFLKTLDPEAW